MIFLEQKYRFLHVVTYYLCIIFLPGFSHWHLASPTLLLRWDRVGGGWRGGDDADCVYFLLYIAMLIRNWSRWWPHNTKVSVCGNTPGLSLALTFPAFFCPPAASESHTRWIFYQIFRVTPQSSQWCWQVLQCQPGDLATVRVWGLRGGGGAPGPPGLWDPLLTALHQEIESLRYQHYKVY